MADDIKNGATAGQDFATETWTLASKNMQSFAGEVAQMSKQSFEHASTAVEKLREAKTFEELMSIQSSFMREAIEAATQRTRRLGEMMTTLPLEMTRAYQDTMMRATETAMKSARAIGEKATDSAKQAMDNAPHV